MVRFQAFQNTFGFDIDRLTFKIGAFGVVSLVKEKETGALYAMKEVRCRKASTDRNRLTHVPEPPTASKERVRTLHLQRGIAG